jgi:hypothetical protein
MQLHDERPRCWKCAVPAACAHVAGHLQLELDVVSFRVSEACCGCSDGLGSSQHGVHGTCARVDADGACRDVVDAHARALC